jgi:hypothetical protein
LTNVIIDLVFDICKNNYHILDKGFFLQALNATELEYKDRSAYLQYVRAVKPTDPKPWELTNIEKLKQDIESKIIPFFQFYEIFEETNFLRGTRFKDFLSQYENLVQTKYGYQSQRKSLEEIKKRLDEAKKNIIVLTLKKTELKFDPTDFKKSLATFIENVGKLTPLAETLREASRKQKQVGQVYFGLAPETYLTTLQRVQTFPNLTQFDIDNVQNILNGFQSISEDATLSDSVRQGLTEAIEALRKKIQSAFIYYDIVDELEFESDQVRRLTPDQKNLENKIEQFSQDENSYIITSSIEEARTILFKLQPNTARDTSGTIAKIYHTLSLLENPNKNALNISIANYILDTLNTGILNNLNQRTNDPFDPYNPYYRPSDSSASIEVLINKLELIAYQIKLGKFYAFQSGLDQMQGFESKININPNNFIDFLKQLNSLDRASTYDYLFKSIVDAGGIFDNDGSVSVFNSLINNVKKYVITDDTNNVLEFDTEGIILFLYDMYGDRPSRPFSLYFGIGLNTTFQVSRGLPLGDERISSLSLASEKIGLKLKMIDFRKEYATENKISSPLVSDWYIFGYGSGLLYNLVNVKSEKAFNHTIIGFGTGLSFYNFLDFNISLGTPLANETLPNWRYRFAGIGFDIKISEYLSELAKKRKNKK